MQPLESRIHYKFRNSLLLAEALTHPSLAYESQKPHFDNQRLEFLGDAVLQLIVTEELYKMFPDFTEGRLTKLRSRVGLDLGGEDAWEVAVSIIAQITAEAHDRPGGALHGRGGPIHPSVEAGS